MCLLIRNYSILLYLQDLILPDLQISILRFQQIFKALISVNYNDRNLTTIKHLNLAKLPLKMFQK